MRFNKNSGFTIMEIVVVLIVMSIIAAFTIGRGRITGAKLKVQTEVLKTHLRHAQARAMNDNLSWGIQTDGSGGAYWLFKYDGSFTTMRLPGEKADTVDLAADGMSLSTGTYSFDPRGVPHYAAHSATEPSTAALAADQIITVSDSGGNYTIVITKNTGFIQ